MHTMSRPSRGHAEGDPVGDRDSDPEGDRGNETKKETLVVALTRCSRLVLIP